MRVLAFSVNYDTVLVGPYETPPMFRPGPNDRQ